MLGFKVNIFFIYMKIEFLKSMYFVGKVLSMYLRL